jgi:hypothetical protein
MTAAGSERLDAVRIRVTLAGSDVDTAIRSYVAASLTYGPIPRDGRPSSLFSGRQRQFLRDCGGSAQGTFEQLRLYGPVQVHQWLVKDQQFDVRLERWSLGAFPARLDFMDLSVLVTPEDAALVQPAFLATTRRRGVDPDAFLGSRTRRLLNQLLLS